MKEIRQTFHERKEIVMGDRLNSCQYLRACVEESLRMSPPVGSSLFREVLEGGEHIDGHVISEGLEVGTGIYSIHHNAVCYPESFTFSPERWLQMSPHIHDKGLSPRAGFNPFSLGPRSCIGRSLALSEIMMTFATVIWMFDFKIPEGALSLIGQGALGSNLGREKPQEYQLYDHVTGAKKGPFLQFRLREHVY
jgi:cytochrome P450